ncbi:ORC-CDC6 family AAA ATPase [Microvirgula aerodenitrificans]|uniref:ORC-CDC6 family AAA ATPase n=1 Tax=Microvirgula aerodenitrificans TaxID=57480 RepID=UPI00248ED44E|nr:hypothetical protein [Microvirgula aerodenitrificans]
MARNNPFALVRAADYTDVQINSLWVELGEAVINAVIEPTSNISKYILGGRGSGKTHLLRYHSYPAVRLRHPNLTGLSVLAEQGYLAVFLRATALDAARFESTSNAHSKWQQLFGVYLELKLVEGLLDALCDIKRTTVDGDFNDRAFLFELSNSVLDQSILEMNSIEEFKKWLVVEKRKIDDAINNSAFTGELDVRVPFSVGSLCLPVKRAIASWNSALQNVPILYLIDEIENFSLLQQQVVNSLIRYGEGMATFRVTGRLYGIKTLTTVGGGEENREGAEFKTLNLDSILKSYPNYGVFAKKFVMKRLGMEYTVPSVSREPSSFFQAIASENFFAGALAALGVDSTSTVFYRPIQDALRNSKKITLTADEINKIVTTLSLSLPLAIQKLNFLVFCKKYSENIDPLALAEDVRLIAVDFISGKSNKGYYSNAYSHYKADIFAQICRESNKLENVPYAGFDTFVQMSSGNPRNLLIILSRAYEIASFKEVDFINDGPLPVSFQTMAVAEAARFMFDRDTNYGGLADQAKVAVERLATLLRTARYSLNIPEVSPLAVSFSDEWLSQSARSVLASALNYSLLFEGKKGRPDRNSHRLNRMVQLNPLLSPRWGLPIGKRGDLSLSAELTMAIFDPEYSKEFDVLLKSLRHKWNNPFSASTSDMEQASLF